MDKLHILKYFILMNYSWQLKIELSFLIRLLSSIIVLDHFKEWIPNDLCHEAVNPRVEKVILLSQAIIVQKRE